MPSASFWLLGVGAAGTVALALLLCGTVGLSAYLFALIVRPEKC